MYETSYQGIHACPHFQPPSRLPNQRVIISPRELHCTGSVDSAGANRGHHTSDWTAAPNKGHKTTRDNNSTKMDSSRRNFVFVATLACTMILHCDALNECTSNPCLNGATCVDGTYGYYTCECSHGYHGTHCEEPLSDNLDDLCYFSVTDPVTMVTSPGFPMVSNHNVICYYVIRIHGAKHIRVTFNALNTEWLKDTIEMGSGSNASIATTTHIRMGRFQQGVVPDGIIFNTSSIFMIYVTDHNIISQGFNATVTADFDDCISSPCQNGGVCLDEFRGFVCDCPLTTTGRLCETDVISISSALLLLADSDVTLTSSAQLLNLSFDLELTPSQHSANPHLAIQSTSTAPSWTVTVFLSPDDLVETNNASRIGELELALTRAQSDFSLENHMTFRDVAVVNMRIPASTTCGDVGYFCAIFNPSMEESSSSTHSSTSSSSSSQGPDYVIQGDPGASAFIACSPVLCRETPPCDTNCQGDCTNTLRCRNKDELSDEPPSDESDQVALHGDSSWNHSHMHIILLFVVAFVCSAFIVVVVIVLVKGRNKVKLLFIHSPSAPSAPVIRWIPPVLPSTTSSTTVERGPATSENYYGIVNEGAIGQIDSPPAPPYSEVPETKK